MAVTAIILGVFFTVFSIVTGRVLDFKKQNQITNDLNRLTYILNKDIFEKDKMTAAENKICFDGYLGAKVYYHFLDNQIIRNSETFIDTFQFKLKKMVLDTVKNESEQYVFQKIKLIIETNEKELDLRFYKRVYPNELIQNIKN